MSPKRPPLPPMKPLDPHEFARAAVPQPDPVRLAIAADPPRLAVVPEQRPVPVQQEVPRPAPTPVSPRAEERPLTSAPVESPPSATAATLPQTPPPPGTASGRAQASRAGKVQVQTWVSEEKRRALKIAAVQSDRTIEELLNDAIDLILGQSTPQSS